MIAIVDYGVGNLYSLKCSLSAIDVDCTVTGNRSVLQNADSIILPGVGAFEDAIFKLREHGLDQVVVEEAKKGKPLMGICLGMQMFYETSYEYGTHEGLGLIAGSIGNMTDDVLGAGLKVPHMGWNDLIIERESPLLENTCAGGFVYFVHSYYAPVSADTIASAQYGPVSLTAALQRDNVFGTQFHPEKSGSVGLGILRAFAGIKA